jgi:hypothetical protein
MQFVPGAVLDGMKRLVGLLTPENVSELMMVQLAAAPSRL